MLSFLISCMAENRDIVGYLVLLSWDITVGENEIRIFG